MNGSSFGTSPSCSRIANIRLNIGERSWRLAQVGQDAFVPYEKMEPMEPCCGQIVITVDGRSSIFDVKLTIGVMPFDDETAEIPIELISQNAF